MPNSLEKSVEDFFVALFKADPRSAGRAIVHFDESTDATTKAIVINAKQGNHSLAGFGGYELECEIEYRAGVNTPSTENDLTAAMMHSIVYDSTISGVTRAAMATTAGLSDLLIKDEQTGSRENTNDLRKRSITLPIQAKLA